MDPYVKKIYLEIESSENDSIIGGTNDNFINSEILLEYLNGISINNIELHSSDILDSDSDSIYDSNSINNQSNKEITHAALRYKHETEFDISNYLKNKN